MFGRHSQASQLRTYSKEPEGPSEVPLVEAQPDEGQEIGADDFTGPRTRIPKFSICREAYGQNSFFLDKLTRSRGDV